MQQWNKHKQREDEFHDKISEPETLSTENISWIKFFLLLAAVEQAQAARGGVPRAEGVRGAVEAAQRGDQGGGGQGEAGRAGQGAGHAGRAQEADGETSLSSFYLK